VLEEAKTFQFGREKSAKDGNSWCAEAAAGDEAQDDAKQAHNADKKQAAVRKPGTAGRSLVNKRQTLLLRRTPRLLLPDGTVQTT
jgi:hypothetical protein